MEIENTNTVSNGYTPPTPPAEPTEPVPTAPASEPVNPPAPLPEDQGQNVNLFA